MNRQNLPFRGDTKIGRLLYDLSSQFHTVNPVSISSESGEIAVNVEYLQELVRDILLDYNKQLDKTALVKHLYDNLWPNNLQEERKDEQRLYLRNAHFITDSSLDAKIGYTFYDVLRNAYGNTNMCGEDLRELFDKVYPPLFPAIKFEHQNYVSDLLAAVGYAARNEHGRFTKRVTSAIFKETGVKLPDTVVTQIGNAYNACRVAAHEYPLAITNNFDWSDGRFGKTDADSCWWGCYTNSRDTLYYYGGYAALFYDIAVDNDCNGNGRMWLFPINDELIIGFNVYGYQGRETAAVVAKLLEKHTGKEWVYGKRTFVNTGRDRDYPYINGDNGHNSSGGSKVFVIYPAGEAKPDSEIEYAFQRKSGYFDQSEDMRICENCGEDYEEDDMTHIHGYYYCRECRNDLFSCCDRCGDYVENDDLRTFEDREDSYYCDSCYDYLREGCCDDCGAEFYSNSNLEEIDGNSYCENCAPNHESEPEEETDEEENEPTE